MKSAAAALRPRAAFAPRPTGYISLVEYLLGAWLMICAYFLSEIRGFRGVDYLQHAHVNTSRAAASKCRILGAARHETHFRSRALALRYIVEMVDIFGRCH